VEETGPEGIMAGAVVAAAETPIGMVCFCNAIVGAVTGLGHERNFEAG